MSRYYCLPSQAVLFMDSLLPMDAFMTTGDTAEMKLVSQIFDFVKSLAELELSEVALALYSAYILLQDGEFVWVRFLSVCHGDFERMSVAMGVNM
jgi:hypothetical protein